MITPQELVIDQKYIDDIKNFFETCDTPLSNELLQRICELIQEGENNNLVQDYGSSTNLGRALVIALFELQSFPDMTIDQFVQYVDLGLRRINLRTALHGHWTRDYLIFRDLVNRIKRN